MLRKKKEKRKTCSKQGGAENTNYIMNLYIDLTKATIHFRAIDSTNFVFAFTTVYTVQAKGQGWRPNFVTFASSIKGKKITAHF